MVFHLYPGLKSWAIAGDPFRISYAVVSNYLYFVLITPKISLPFRFD